MLPDFKLPLYPFQQEIFEKRRTLEADCLFLDMGCGKSALTISMIADRYRTGAIDAALVVAPNGVHKDWVLEHLPKHLWDSVARETQALYWTSSKAGTKKAERARNDLLNHKGLAILTVSYEGLMTERGRVFVKKFLTERRCFYVLDEAHLIKTPGTKRTKTILASGKYAPVRRILTGTPCASGKPFDVYSLSRFTHPDFWKSKGLGSFQSFKTFFGVWETGFNGQTNREFQHCVGYQNLHLLEKWLKEVSVRVSIEDVLDLPAPVYTSRRFEMTSEQRRVYNEIATEFLTVLGGQEISLPMAIVRMLRLQQVTSGYLPIDDVDADGFPTGNKVLIPLEGGNPRLNLLEEIVSDLNKKTVIWARFTEDIDQILAMLERNGRRAVRYDGRVKDAERTANKLAFSQGDAEFFVGNPAAGGTGVDGLQVAHYAIYYSNSLKLVDRTQSERRTYRSGLRHTVVYLDIVAENSLDSHIVDVLRQGLDISQQITGDRAREWLSLA
jgi:SNF2 family DNA or RNA helicase